MELDAIDRRIINSLQGGFPLCDEPWGEAADGLDLDAGQLLERVARLRERGVLSRFGPLFQIERIGGRFLLAAMKVPEADYERVAELVNGFAAVAHNYRREHALNMWFVLATETPEGIPAAIAGIETATGLPVFAFPKEREYFVELKLHA